MKKVVAFVAVAGLLALGGQAAAELGTIDDVPAATLLLPYFEQDITNQTGVSTLFSVNNASAAPTVVHVTVWSEYSIPLFDFDIYLTGYDVQTINMYDVLANGILPVTGVNISPNGAWSDPNVNFVNPIDPDVCTDSSTANGFAPAYTPVTGQVLDAWQESTTGLPVGLASNQCYSTTGGGEIAKGFITFDVVRWCNEQFPDSTGYFQDGGAGTALNDNIIWGDWFITDEGGSQAQGDTLVAIEADGTALSAAAGSCDTSDFYPTTFYCFTSFNSTDPAGSDNREGLPSVYAVRYLTGGTFDGGTTLRVWRDGNDVGSPFACGSPPVPFGQEQIAAFDEDENPFTPPTDPPGPSGFEPPDPAAEVPFPRCVNMTTVTEEGGGGDLTVHAPFGWLFLNLNNAANVNMDPDHNQAYVSALYSAKEGRFSVGLAGFALNNLTLGSDQPSNPIIGPGAP